MRRLIFTMPWLGAMLVVPMLAYGQSCALCYQSAASSGPQLLQALRRGILILLVPPLLIGAGFAWMAYRKRGSFRTLEAEPLKNVAREEPEVTRAVTIPVEESVSQ